MSTRKFLLPFWDKHCHSQILVLYEGKFLLTWLHTLFFFEVNLVGTQEKYMGTDKVAFAVDRTIAHDRKWRQSRDRKYILRMCNRKLRHIRPSVAFWPEVTVTWPEEALFGSRFCTCPAFSHAFFLVVEPDVTEGHLNPSEFPWDRKWRQSCDRKWPCPEVYSAHAQPKVVPYPP